MLSLGLLAAAGALSEPVGWTRRHSTPVHRAATVSFSVCVKHQRMDELFQTAIDVSTPGHPRYGRFLSVDAIDAMVAPNPSDMQTVVSWLDEHGVAYLHRKECLEVSTTVALAERLLKTTFAQYWRKADGRTHLRAGEYTLPPYVASVVEAVFGLHGVPLPPREPNPAPKQPAAVTPTVLAQTYRVGKPYVNRGGNNKQAVAEFQGEYMSKEDLQTFFANEVPSAMPGDEAVSKFVGVPYKKGTGVEALLDIEFIMGVAPGVKTEFWEWPDRDFCADLYNYTSTLLAPGGPIVNSISYGWQGDLEQVGCHTAEVAKVDANWAKLAAAGISMFISSGDSGSQCTSNACNKKTLKAGTKVKDGHVKGTRDAMLQTCCEEAEQQQAAAFTWVPPKHDADRHDVLRHRAALVEEARAVAPPGSPPPPPPPPYHFDKAVFHVTFSVDSGRFPRKDVHVLDGIIPGTAAGSVKLHSANGTFSDTTIIFGKPDASSGIIHRRPINVTLTVGGKSKSFGGKATFYVALNLCTQLLWETEEGHIDAELNFGPNPPPPPPEGNCTLYESITGTEPAPDPQTTSGGPSVAPAHVVLFPSWPASSPWVTSVGATRFLNQTAGHEEMATDQFGSGGGFSTMWNQSHAQWQAAAVAKYVAMGPSLPKWPPPGSFPPLGRATPDVSALGEGYQVYVGGRVQSVGGTSASSPAFAGYVSLLNEARFKAGKPQMGFINPFVYQNPDAFTDVVKGTNAIGRGTGPLKYGFAAAPGWDAATGLGTPLFDKLLKAALEVAP